MAGPWERYAQPAPPVGDPVIAPPDPYKQRAEARAEEDQQFQREKFRTEQERADRQERKDNAGTVDEKRIATLLTRIAGGFNDIQTVSQDNPEAQAPGFVEAVRGDLMPGGLGGVVTRSIAGSDRRSIHDAQRDVLDALLTLGTGAAYNAEQLSGQMASYFPQYGDGEAEVQAKNQRLLRLIEAAKANAGPAWDNVAPAIEPFMQQISEPANDDFREGLNDEGILQVRVTDDSPPPPDPLRPDVEARVAQIDERVGPAGVSDLLRQGFTLGLSDEAAGIGGAISGLLRGDPNIIRNYQIDRDAEEMRIQAARDRLGGIGTASELLGGLGVGGAAKGISTIGQAARAGAEVGAVGGAGYGRGFENSAGNALLGAGLGASIGAGGARLGQIVGGRQTAQNALGQHAQDLAQAGQAEGVTVNRAMIDPRLANRVTGTDASLVGGPRVQRGMRAIEEQVEGRVKDLGRGGTPLNPEEAGGTVRGAAERFIERSGKAAKVKYDRAEKLAGNAKVEPRQSLQAVDQMIAQLSETGATNSAEIAFLQGLRSDLSKDLSVGALRRLRTSLRKRINRGELTFGEDEGRVLAIMDTAADDIRAGLTAQGNARAARAFDAADKAYRARMEYINGTVQKVLGRRNANKTPEQVFTTLSNMAKGKDAAGLRKFYATLEPDEAADVAATFAADLGKNSKGEFSVAHFLSQSDKFSDSALATIFGKEGAQSVKNLRLLGKEINRVTSDMNSRKSGTAVANDWQSWMFNIVLGLSPGAATGSATTAIAGAAGVGTAKAARDILTARALMSPKITKWLRMAPKTSSPRAIDRHFEQLGAIARAEPSLAPEVERIQQAIWRAANDNAAITTSAAQDQNAQER